MRGSAIRVHRIVLVQEVVVLLLVGAAGLVPVRVVETQRLHAALDELADGPLRAVAHASVQLLTLRDLAHVGDHIPAGVRAHRPVKKFPAVVEIVVHGGAALRVSLALVPGLRAPGAGSPGQTGLDGPLGVRARRVVAAAAVLQRRAVLGEVELDQRGDAVARTLLPLPSQHRAARAAVVLVRVIALGLGLAVHDGLPANQPPAVGRGSQGEVGERQEQASEGPQARDAPEQSAGAGHGYGGETRRSSQRRHGEGKSCTRLPGIVLFIPWQMVRVGPCVWAFNRLAQGCVIPAP